MNHYRLRIGTISLLVLLGIAAGAHAQSESKTSAPSSAAAYVYLSSSPASGVYEINAYRAGSDGMLAPVYGSPFATNGTYMATNGTWLFDTDGIDIYSFKIASDGALQEGAAVDAQKFNPDPSSGGPVSLFPDRSGQSLYDGDIYADGANNGYQFWNVVESTGQLDYVGITSNLNVNFDPPLSFIGDDEYAYESNCVKGFQSIFGFRRDKNGALRQLNINPFIPTPAISGSAYCPYLAAADPANHVAISLTPFEPYQNTGPPQIAVYTASSTGDLTTTSTASNMPASEVVSVLDMKMSPSGKLLALAGSGGLQIFHFNGSNPATLYTGLLTTDEIDQMFWDNANHLYALSVPAGKLFVFTVTPTRVSEAPGSPHAIAGPQAIAVSPRN